MQARKNSAHKPNEAAGGVVISGPNVLVLFIATRQEYRLPKGHIDEGETPAETALREVGEESGYLDLRILANLGTHTVEFDYNGKHVLRTEHYFLMNLEKEIRRGPGEPKFEPLWLPMDEALDNLTFEAEKQWLRRAIPFISSKQGF
jgi:8-oxo-dGTP pyrophosphatase MutT (NUDIX family)